MTSCWLWSRSFLWCPPLLCGPVGQLPASTQAVSIKYKEERYKKVEERAKCTFRNISLFNPPEAWATQTHTRTHTHCRRLTAPSGSSAAEVRMKGNTKTTTRERQVAGLAAHAHTPTHGYTQTHARINSVRLKNPCCAHLWKCQISDCSAFVLPQALCLWSLSLSLLAFPNNKSSLPLSASERSAA